MSAHDLSCQELVEIVTDYLEGRLAAAEVAAIDEHLQECPGCAAYIAQMRALVRIAGAEREPELERLAAKLLPAFRTLRRGLA
jgi:anti-sigma factor RsiW